MKLLIILLACLLTSTCNKGTEYHIPPPVVSDKPSTPDTPVVEEPDADVLRLATYNVGVFSKSGTNTTLMIVEMMKELGVCALSMNELDSCNTRHQVFQLKSFAREMGSWDYTYAPALNYKGGWYGIGIASDPKLNIIRRFRLKLSQAGGSEVRALAVSEFQDFVFCSTHLDHKSKDAQLVQAGEITAWVEKTYANSRKPVILCGDFNALPSSGTLAYMRQNWTILSPDGFTYPASNPSKCIDYIMVYKNAADRIELKDAKIPVKFTTGDVAVASDHLPVYVDIVIK
ncbi:MAG: endonuclease/exonuclease/phosphatase family protein [Bacteroidales bacterium]|nr:endonuclease/exonuclease/phosphatase family protein [Bacteroidales bacterium]